MKIGIIGTRGIPNQYGGFEQFAENFSTRMADRGHDVTVYTSHRHPYTSSYYKNVQLIRCYDPEYMLGTAGQFIYDFNCIKNSRNQHFDIILQLGYTSSTIWSWLYPKSAILATNMDGLEWSRAKYNRLTQEFLKYAEKWGVKYSNYLIADSKGIADYLEEKYDAQTTMVPYGADIYEAGTKDLDILDEFSLERNGYDLLIARFEPENNIETILKAYAPAANRKIVLIGDYHHTSFGRKMFKEYGAYEHIIFAGPEFNMQKLNAIRSSSRLYLHGHSVGGTNPSLLEAMSCNALICANDNRFNRYVLGNDAFYFKNENDISILLSLSINKDNYVNWVKSNKEKIKTDYNWDSITLRIESHFKAWINAEHRQAAQQTRVIKKLQPLNELDH